MDIATRDAQTQTICRYYEGCTAGDLDLLHHTLHADVVHYFLAPNPGSAPVRSRQYLARYWRKVTRKIDARWIVDKALTMGNETVIEWTLFWRAEADGPRIQTRGAEWFVFQDGLIIEIRSYYQQQPFDTALDAFAYDERGYSVAGRERSALHPEADQFCAPTGEDQ